jgi:hypothetical protein
VRHSRPGQGFDALSVPLERNEEQKTDHLLMLGHWWAGLVAAHHEAGFLARHGIGKESGRVR